MNGPENSLTVILVIAGAALVTYAFRFGGLMLSERLPSTGKFKDFMEALPGTILVALVAPGVVAAGFWGCLAALSTALLVRKTGNIFIAMLSGMLIVAGARGLGM
jgi:uncharacterized membrane protein